MGNTFHVLLVDDDVDLLESVKDFLCDRGIEVSCAATGQQALKQFEEEKPDIVVLDIVLGDSDGIELCREIRLKSSVPIIFLSGRTDDTERIVGLEIGADDYMTKPFNPRELLARIRATLRRTQAVQATAPEPVRERYHLARFGPWTLDEDESCLWDTEGKKTDLSFGEYRILKSFLKHPFTALTRVELLHDAYGKNHNVTDRNIDNFIRMLRQKIEQSPSDPKLLKTVWGKGYILNCDVTLADTA